MYRWPGWVWERIGWSLSRLQGITDHLRNNLENIPQVNHEEPKDHTTCNRLDPETLGFWLTIPKIKRSGGFVEWKTLHGLVKSKWLSQIHPAGNGGCADNVFLRRLDPMNGENRPLLTDDRAEFEKELVEVHQDFTELPQVNHEEPKHHTTCNRLHLETLGFWPIITKIKRPGGFVKSKTLHGLVKSKWLSQILQ